GRALPGRPHRAAVRRGDDLRQPADADRAERGRLRSDRHLSRDPAREQPAGQGQPRRDGAVMMTLAASLATAEPVVFLPGSRGEDALAQYWLRQVTLRMRREVCWLWRERPLQAGEGTSATAAQPPFVDRALGTLDLSRYDRDKRAFFASDVTAAHLCERIAAPPPSTATTIRGSFAWVAQTLRLAPVECFVLATALLPV